MAKLKVFDHKIKDGHAPGLSGKDLCAYVHAGITSDHECTTLEEAREKLQMGMHIMIREGSAAKNLDALLPLVNEHNSRYCFFVTDDTDPGDIMEKGHINRLVRKAIKKGIDPLRAIQMATINAATYFRLKGLGAVLPGYRADLLVLDDLEELSIERVYQGGRLAARRGELLVPVSSPEGDLPTSMNVDWDKVNDLSIEARGRSVNVIEVIPGQIVTKRIVESALIENGCVVSDPSRDMLKIAVIERHHGTGSFSVGLIRGFGLKEGAIGCTVAHDSHNMIIVGVKDEDMMAAARELAGMGGGMAVVSKAAAMQRLPLPIAGLMSNATVQEVEVGLRSAVAAARKLGCELENPFATLSFMALTPIPELKLTDQGLFDSVNFQFVPVFAD